MKKNSDLFYNLNDLRKIFLTTALMGIYGKIGLAKYNPKSFFLNEKKPGRIIKNSNNNSKIIRFHTEKENKKTKKPNVAQIQ